MSGMTRSLRKNILRKFRKELEEMERERWIDESEYLKRVEEKMEEENEKIRGRDWRTGHFSREEILRGR